MSPDDRRDDLEREIRTHLELEVEERIADGESTDAARCAAHRAFGNVARVHEDSRAVWIPPWFDHAGQDVRYAARRLRRSPAFALTAILILTAGIGLNLGFFQLLNVAVLRPLPVADLASLVRFDRITRHFSSNGIPYPATQYIREHNDVLSAVLTSASDDVVWGEDPNDRVSTLYVSANWFRELGQDAAQGRLFDASIDERPDSPLLAVVSHEFWETRLQSEAVAGRTIRINDRPAILIGVARRGFTGLRLSDTAVWLLIHQKDQFNPGSRFADDWGGHNTQLYARLKPGVSPTAAREGLRPTIRELAAARPAEFAADETLHPYSGLDGFRTPRDVAKMRTIGLLIGGLMLIVFVVACANLSNLVLSQSISRLREFSLRAALGASKWRILRQQIVESAVLTVTGTLGGLFAGHWCARFVGAQVALPRDSDFTLDWRVMLAACAIAFLATLAVGIVPAWLISRRQLATAMKDGGHQTSSGLSRARFRQVSIAAQVTGCCILLIVAGSTVRGLQRVLSDDLGFAFEHVAALDPSLPRYGVTSAEARVFWDTVKASLATTPEVEVVALASFAPLAGSSNRSRYNDVPRLTVTHNHVEPSFFSLLRIPFVAGRNFVGSDAAAGTVILSRRLALAMYGTLDVVGQGFPRSKPDRTVVGIVADAPLINVAATSVAEAYFPIGSDHYAPLVLLVGARSDPRPVLLPLREASRRADERVLPRTWLPSQDFAVRVQARQMASLLAGMIGLLALALACFGIYGLVSYASTLRTREIGIRRALGAGRGAVIRLLLRQLVVPLAIGVLLGSITGVFVGTILEGEPFFLPAPDIATPLVAVGVFVATACAAALVPALRSLRLDPLDALRHE